MFFVTGLALVTGAMIGLARGGRLRFVGHHQMRAWWLILVGFGLQLATDHLAGGRLGTAMVLVGAAALLAFAVLNPNLVGIGVVAVGVAANALVIGLNDGMPVRPDAVIAAHIASRADEPAIGYGYRHHRERPSDKLGLLADIIPIPHLREVVSVGDLILAFGVAATTGHLFQAKPRHASPAHQSPRS